MGYTLHWCRLDRESNLRPDAWGGLNILRLMSFSWGIHSIAGVTTYRVFVVEGSTVSAWIKLPGAMYGRPRLWHVECVVWSGRYGLFGLVGYNVGHLAGWRSWYRLARDGYSTFCIVMVDVKYSQDSEIMSRTRWPANLIGLPNHLRFVLK